MYRLGLGQAWVARLVVGYREVVVCWGWDCWWALGLGRGMEKDVLFLF